MRTARRIQMYRERPPAVIVGWTVKHPGGLGARRWVLDALGSVPSDPVAAAVYLVAAAHLTAPGDVA